MKSLEQTFLFPILLSGLFVVGCANKTIEPQPLFQLEPDTNKEHAILEYANILGSRDFERAINPPNPIFFASSTPRDIMDKWLDVTDEERADLLFNSLCRAGKAKRNLSSPVTLIIPKVPPGIPIDKVNNLRKENLVKLRRSLIQMLLDFQSKPSVFSQDQYFDTKKKLESNPNEVVRFYFPVSFSKSREEFINERKNAAVDWSRMSDLVSVSLPGDETIYIVDDKFPIMKYYSDGEFKIEAKIKESVNLNEKYRHNGNNLFLVNKNGWKLDKAFYPVWTSYFADINTLRHSFVLLFPKQAIPKGLDWENYFYHSDGSPSIEKAIDSTEPIWDDYFRVFTDIKESPTEDPSVINFSITVNMDPFCSYAQRTSSLLSN